MNAEPLKEIELEMVENMTLSDIKGIQKEFMNEPLVTSSFYNMVSTVLVLVTFAMFIQGNSDMIMEDATLLKQSVKISFWVPFHL